MSASTSFIGRRLFAAAVFALGSSWLIGRACHALGLHHSLAHGIAEVSVLFLLSLPLVLRSTPSR